MMLPNVADVSQIGFQCFPAGFCHPPVGNFDSFPYFSVKMLFLLTLAAIIPEGAALVVILRSRRPEVRCWYRSGVKVGTVPRA